MQFFLTIEPGVSIHHIKAGTANVCTCEEISNFWTLARNCPHRPEQLLPAPTHAHWSTRWLAQIRRSQSLLQQYICVRIKARKRQQLDEWINKHQRCIFAVPGCAQQSNI